MKKDLHRNWKGRVILTDTRYPRSVKDDEKRSWPDWFYEDVATARSAIRLGRPIPPNVAATGMRWVR